MSQLDDPDIRPPEEFGIKFSIIWMIHLSRVTTTTPRPGRGGRRRSPCSRMGSATLRRPENCDEPAVFAVYDPELAFGHATNLPLYREFFHDAIVKDEQGRHLHRGRHQLRSTWVPVNPFQPAFGGDDAVVAVLAPGTLQKAMVSFLGGDGFGRRRRSRWIDFRGNILVAGLTTLSTTFPTTPGALQTAPKGRNDGFLVKISWLGRSRRRRIFGLSFAEPNVTVARGSKITVTLDIERVGGFAGKVKVTPPAAVAGFKVPKKVSTSGSSVALKFKVKPDAPAGPTSFTGTDKDGRTRSATITLNVE
ncbi:MAG: hypothetical protein U0Q11_27215 [Vicinamibacterales bacterium]